MKDAATAGPLFPIGAVARRTGLSTHVLRAWERRYGVVTPKRVDGDRRVYDDADVLKLRLLKRVTEAGHPIGGVAGFSTEQLLEILHDEPVANAPNHRRGSEHELAECLEAIEAMDGGRVHRLLMRSLLLNGTDRFIESLVVPLLYRVGDLWESGSIYPAREHLFSAKLKRVLGWSIEQLVIGGARPVIVSTTPSGQRHEIGALLSAVVAAEEGWRVEYLGPDLPASDIVRAAITTGAKVIALSVVQPLAAEALIGEVRAVREQLGGDVAILVGGRAALEHKNDLEREGAICLRELSELRDQLQRMRAEIEERAA